MIYLFIWEFIALCLISPLWANVEQVLQDAHANYQQGEKATTYEERKLAFNRALFLYHSLEPDIPNAHLDQALGDTYFQLGEYAWAVLYYQRALKKNSQNISVVSHLKEAQQKLGVSPLMNEENKIESFFPLSKQFKLLFWVILVTFLTFSCTIWFPFTWIRKLAIVCAVFLGLLLANLLFVYYSTPVEGILIKTTGFYRAPTWNQPQLTDQPLLAGSKVKILQITNEGEWLKIENSAEMIGYIPSAVLRPI